MVYLYYKIIKMIVVLVVVIVFALMAILLPGEGSSYAKGASNKIKNVSDKNFFL